MKVKDLKGNPNMSGIKVKTPNGVVGYWSSQWGYDDGGAGVWLSIKPERGGNIYPQFVDKLKDCLEWEVTEDVVNCHKQQSYNTIDNRRDKS